MLIFQKNRPSGPYYVLVHLKLRADTLDENFFIICKFETEFYRRSFYTRNFVFSLVGVLRRLRERGNSARSWSIPISFGENFESVKEIWFIVCVLTFGIVFCIARYQGLIIDN